MVGPGTDPRRPGSSRRDPGPRTAAPLSRSSGARSAAATEPDLGGLAQALLDAMVAIRRMARRVASDPSALSQLTGSQLELVRAVEQRPGISVAEAADTLRLAPNTVSTLVGQLIDAGIVVRTQDDDDRRVARLALGAEGSRTVADWNDRRTEAVTSVLARLSLQDRRRLQDAQSVLARIASLLEEDAMTADRAADRAEDRRSGRGRSAGRPAPGDTSPSR